MKYPVLDSQFEDANIIGLANTLTEAKEIIKDFNKTLCRHPIEKNHTPHLNENICLKKFTGEDLLIDGEDFMRLFPESYYPILNI